MRCVFHPLFSSLFPLRLTFLLLFLPSFPSLASSACPPPPPHSSLSLSHLPPPQAPDAGRMSRKTYDLDSKDFFWAKNAHHPFPQVAEEIDIELNKYKQDAQEITRSTGVSDVGDLAQLYVPISPLLLSCSPPHPSSSSRLAVDGY